MNKIALIIPYFGKFNNYFPLFLASCRYNDTIDWIIFTDDKTNYDYPDNVIVHYTTFENIKNKIQKHFIFDICLETPYKLCDYRAVYGEVFEDYLKDYEFWGYCDTDVIFGDIRKFITEELLNKYQKLLTHGHLTFYKNTPENNAMYKLFDYKTVFTNPQAFAFDETGVDGGINSIFEKYNIEVYDEIIYADILFYYKGFFLSQLKKDKKDKKRKYNIFQWNNGSLERWYLEDNEVMSQEILYLHMQKRLFSEVVKSHFGKAVLIVPNKFIRIDNSINKKTLKKYGKRKTYCGRYFYIRYNNMLKKIMRFKKNSKIL